MLKKCRFLKPPKITLAFCSLLFTLAQPCEALAQGGGWIFDRENRDTTSKQGTRVIFPKNFQSKTPRRKPGYSTGNQTNQPGTDGSNQTNFGQSDFGNYPSFDSQAGNTTIGTSGGPSDNNFSQSAPMNNFQKNFVKGQAMSQANNANASMIASYNQQIESEVYRTQDYASSARNAMDQISSTGDLGQKQALASQARSYASSARASAAKAYSLAGSANSPLGNDLANRAQSISDQAQAYADRATSLAESNW
jgi:hypothetical protein